MITIKDTYIYKSTTFALYLIALANERKIALNITKVQKLLYIAYGVYLRVYKERLLNEHPQAWPYGPVFPTTRNKLVKRDFEEITRGSIEKTDLEEMENDENLNKVIDFVFKHFGSWNSGQLSEWSHSEGSPWYLATMRADFDWGDLISDNDIYEYFTKIVSVN